MIRNVSTLIITLFLTSCMSSGTDKYTSAPTLRSLSSKPSSSFSDAPQKPDLDVLDVETRIQIKDLCSDTKDDGIVPYWNCLDKELQKIDGLFQPDLDVLDVETRIQIKDLCSDTKDDGIVPYWNCFRKELASIGITSTEKPSKNPR